MGTESFGITLQRPAGGVIVAQASGEIDVTSSHAFRDRLLALLDEEPARVVVDLSNVAYVDTYALSALVEVANHCKLEGCNLALVCSEGRMRRALADTGLDQFVATHATLDEALNHGHPNP